MELVIKRFDELDAAELYEIMRVRQAVFVVEQNCPYQDADGADAEALHVCLREGAEIRAYLRVLRRGGEVYIGRVLTAERGLGLGARVLEAGMEAARERLAARRIYVEAQTYAEGFYARVGFVRCSEEFLEDGIPHVKMRLDMD
jgi:ElaA protein